MARPTGPRALLAAFLAELAQLAEAGESKKVLKPMRALVPSNRTPAPEAIPAREPLAVRPAPLAADAATPGREAEASAPSFPVPPARA